MHIGGLRTALYSYLFAKQHGGKFILRIEDTDIKREVKGATDAIINGLKWAGLNYDEGPYFQSQRLNTYRKYAMELVKNQHAYCCFCNEEMLEKMRQKQIADHQVPKYDRRCMFLSEGEIQKKLKAETPYVIRMKIPNNRIIEINDIIRGKVLYNSNELDDQVLLKSDGYPTYHLAVVVDDHLMGISHVTRTEEWLPSTPKHILLYEFFGWPEPKWAHLPLLLNPDRTKMSKRKGDVALSDYIERGYLPEAMINFLAFLGWNPGPPAFAKASTGKEKEIYSMKELLKDFSLEKVQKSGAVFNIEKLDWFNSYYIRQMSVNELTKKIIPYFTKENLIKENEHDLEYVKKIVALEKPRLKNLSEIGDRVGFFFKIPQFEPALLIWRGMSFKDVVISLNISRKALTEIDENNFNCGNLEKGLLREAKRAKNKDKGHLLWPLRVALTGLEASPGPFEILEILGKKESLKRIEAAVKKLA